MTGNVFGKPHDFITELTRISGMAHHLRRLRPEVTTSWEEPADWVVKDANLHGLPVTSLTITLTPTGCEWADHGGCTMCGEYEGSTKGQFLPPEFHIAQFATALSKYAAKYNPAWLRIYQEGNYANSREMPPDTQTSILRLASLIAGIKRITIESLAKYITPEIAASWAGAVARDVELEVGMGFEAQDDVVRNVCVNKGESIQDFHRAVGLLKTTGIKSLAYVLIKPPFLTEREAITEAIATIRVANEMGFDAISIEPTSIHPYSLVHALSLEGAYEVPWLWSVVTVALSGRAVPDLRIGGIGFYPRPINVANNRHRCTERDCNEAFWMALKGYGRTRQLDLLESLECSCKADWQAVCETAAEPLRLRIDQQLACLDIDRYAGVVRREGVVRARLVDSASSTSGASQYRR